MEIKRAYDILNNKEIKEVLYNDKPVWIQSVSNQTAKIGFLDKSIPETDVYVKDVYEC